jgi:hypothetical protein
MTTTVVAESVALDVTTAVAAGPQDEWFQPESSGRWVDKATGPVIDKPAIRVIKRESVKVLDEEEQAKVEEVAAQKAKAAKTKAEKAQKLRDLQDMDPRERPTRKSLSDIALQSKTCPGFYIGREPHEKESRDDDYCKNCLNDKRRWLSRCPNFSDTNDREGCRGYRFYDKEAGDYVPLCSNCHAKARNSEAPQCPYFGEFCNNYLMWNHRARAYFEYCKSCQNYLDKRCPNYEGSNGRQGCGGHRRWNHDLKKYTGFCRECSQVVGPRPKGFQRNHDPPKEY